MPGDKSLLKRNLVKAKSCQGEAHHAKDSTNSLSANSVLTKTQLHLKRKKPPSRDGINHHPLSSTALNLTNRIALLLAGRLGLDGYRCGCSQTTNITPSNSDRYDKPKPARLVS